MHGTDSAGKGMRMGVFSRGAFRRLPALALRALLLAALSLAVAALAVFGSAIKGTGWIHGAIGPLVAQTLAIAPAVALVILLLGAASARLSRPPRDGSRPSRLRGPLGPLVSPGAPGVLLTAVLIFACWLPWLVSLYPGAMIYDTYYQISQCYPVWSPEGFSIGAVWGVPDGFRFSDHHPILVTLLYGSFARASQALTGSWDAGVFAFAALQCAGTALAFSCALGTLGRHGAPSWLRLAALLLICSVPVYGDYASTVVKDSLFSGIYVLWFSQLVEVIATRGASLGRPGFLAASFATACLLALTRKTGAYVAVPTLALLALLYRPGRFRLAAQAAGVALLVWGVLPGAVFPALSVSPGGRQEALGTLFQQTARCALLFPGEMTAGEAAAVESVLGEGFADRYKPKWADPVKYGFDPDASAGELGDYLGVWARQGLRHPDVYAEGALAMTAGFVAPGGEIQLRDEVWDKKNSGTELLEQPDELKQARRSMCSYWNAWQDSPIAGALLDAAPYVVWVPALALWSLSRRATWRWLPLLIPTGLTVASVALSPMFDARYALPLIYTAPLLLCVLGAAARGGSPEAGRA